MTRVFRKESPPCHSPAGRVLFQVHFSYTCYDVCAVRRHADTAPLATRQPLGAAALEFYRFHPPR